MQVTLDIKDAWWDTLLFVSGQATVYYHIDDIPYELKGHYKDVLKKNRVAIINTHFDD